jgi:hypothetical protein
MSAPTAGVTEIPIFAPKHVLVHRKILSLRQNLSHAEIFIFFCLLGEVLNVNDKDEDKKAIAQLLPREENVKENRNCCCLSSRVRPQTKRRRGTESALFNYATDNKSEHQCQLVRVFRRLVVR